MHLLTSALLALSLLPSTAMATPAIEENSTILATLQRLHAVSSPAASDEERRRAVDEALAKITESELLARTAVAARFMSSGRAEDESIDRVYWIAFWECVKRLAARTDDASVMQLERVAVDANLGGGELMLMNEARERQKRAIRERKEKR